MSWFTRKPSRPPQRRYTRLSVEKFEDRCLMAGVPLPESYDLLTGDMGEVAPQYRESAAENIVAGNRAGMAEVHSKASDAVNSPADWKKKPTYAIWNGYLVIYGTPASDIGSIQEYPARYDQKGTLVKKAEYHIDLQAVDGKKVVGRLQKTIDREQVAHKGIFFYGYGQNDTFGLAASAGSLTRLYADGGDGDDTLKGGPQADFLDGGASAAALDRLTGNAGNDVLAGGAGDDLIWGNAGFDLLDGEGGTDTLEGMEGNDNLFGGDGDDNNIRSKKLAGGLDGGAGDDYLFGGGGKDKLLGGAGKDYLDGGPDSDELYGGSDADRFKVEKQLEAKDFNRFNKKEGDTWVTGAGASFTMSLLGSDLVDATAKPKKK